MQPVRSDIEIDPLLSSDWHVVADLEALGSHGEVKTALLGISLYIRKDGDAVHVNRRDGQSIACLVRFGFVWACLQEPDRSVVDILEYAEAERCIVTGGSFGVRTSGPRVIENFLDLGHLGYVHAGYLGAEPYTRIAPYDVHPLPDGGIIATGCKIFQPMASPAAMGGYVVDYVYKVVRPLTVCLMKANPIHRDRFDVIYLFVQPVFEDFSIAHPLLLFVAEGTSASALRAFQQLIFLQDKPILENQFPKRLPIGPRMEMPIAADKSSVAYRRWLSEIGLQYGVLREEDHI